MQETIVDISTKREYIIDAPKGGENKQPCPVCSDSRDKKKAKVFSYNGTQGAGNCIHCGAKFVKKKERVMEEKKEYKRPVWTNITDLPDKVVTWFKGRGISQSTLIENKVTACANEWMPNFKNGTNVICFNYFRDGDLVNIKYRDANKGFKLVAGAELIFYGLDQIKGEKECVIVEGEIDKLSFHEVGITNVVSVPNGAVKGTSKLEYFDNCWEAFEGMDKIYLATDDDEPGRLLQEELARRLGKERCVKTSFFGCKDANELLVKDRLKLTETLQNSTEYQIEGVYTASDIKDEIWDLWKNGLQPGCKIGKPGFDNLLTFEGGYLTVVTGIIGHGKSEWVDEMCLGLGIHHGWKTAYYSPENFPLKVHYSKITSKLTGKHFNDHTGDELQAGIEYSSQNHYFIFPEKDFTLDSILDTARQLVKKHGVKILVIDAWNKLEHKYTTSETQYISAELDKIDVFCKSTGVHVFLVAHPTKMRKEKDGTAFEIPNLYSISGSAAFANKAANGICVYRRFITSETARDAESITEVYVQKVKFSHWGQTGMATMQFDKETKRFYETTRDRRNYIERKQIEAEFTEQPKSAIQANTAFTIDSAAVKESQEENHIDADFMSVPLGGRK